MEKFLQAFSRLTALLEQCDTTAQGMAQLEVQAATLVNMKGDSKSIIQARAETAKALTSLENQNKAALVTLADLTGGMTPEALRERLSEIRVAIEQVGEYSLEEKRVRGAYEILSEANEFGEEVGDTKEDYIARLDSLKKVKDIATARLDRLVSGTVNQNHIIVAGEAALKQLQGEGNVITIG